MVSGLPWQRQRQTLTLQDDGTSGATTHGGGVIAITPFKCLPCWCRITQTFHDALKQSCLFLMIHKLHSRIFHQRQEGGIKCSSEHRAAQQGKGQQRGWTSGSHNVSNRQTQKKTQLVSGSRTGRTMAIKVRTMRSSWGGDAINWEGP